MQDKEFTEDYYVEIKKTHIAVEIRRFRKKAGITQKELAMMINTTQSAVSRIENPRYKKYSLSVLRRVANALNLEISVSFKEKGDK